ncbi:2-oxoisovalerate dehydrogenase E1 component [Antricoccus suffuscus]|uniref:2-oxoisovalerate dehydrogenase E1 component n=1 Tax=Antricoccus suffuscus TaxID=1629062 RepID=A0A2T0ZXS8_9ACTN|nr:thiamine pyrophosphate-dependent enzyme [Antricoccus suffuscus]PRZ41150.1 2-oxoisovalerate dehydrogenase E1 component [Antricoccus suffuscus]
MTAPPREPVDLHFENALASMSRRTDREHPAEPRPADLLRIFDAQLGSRLLDFQARIMRAAGEGYYTIGSSGHEGNAYVADALRPTDPAFLHYRSGGFYLARAQQVDGIDGTEDVLLSLAASVDDPISGGRHKVFGREELAIIPATSTIASHLPRAVGAAFAIERAKKLGVESAWPRDAIAVCSFGDASANHSTAVGAINSACNMAFQGLNVPLLFLCEDNGIGISVKTPNGWIAASYADRPGLKYFFADSADPVQMWTVAREAADYVRRKRKPAFLHVSCVRYMAHAGSDAELSYRSRAEIEADYARDPLLATAQVLIDSGEQTPEELTERVAEARAGIAQIADTVVSRPKLTSALEVMAPLAPRHPRVVREWAISAADPESRTSVFEGKLPEVEGKLTLSASINRALADGLAQYDGMLVFGEDVGRKGGVYGVTQRLQKRFGVARVYDSLLDEQSILGLALGCAVSGLLPVPEIQYLAYLHNAIDQLRGEAATQQFFSEGRYTNGMVVRIAGLAYQKGFGGHFHNDNSLAALRDIPGLVLAVPSRGDDAAAMMRTALAAARVDGTVTAYVEPIALYHERDLFEPGDEGLLSDYLAPGDWDRGHVEIGRARSYAPNDFPEEALTIVTFGNGVPMSRRVAQRLVDEGHGVRVLDLRWLAPLPVDDLVAAAELTGRVLIADETRASGGVSEAVTTALIDAGFDGKIARVTSKDSFVPLADAANLVLLSEDAIEDAARKMLDQIGTARASQS